MLLRDAMRVPGVNGGGPDRKDFIQTGRRSGQPDYQLETLVVDGVQAVRVWLEIRPENSFYTPMSNVKDFQALVIDAPAEKAVEAKGKARP